ncbi:MAG: YggS family pyridoxal phosphate-dependent enzyme [Planctomycetia bacterium]|nr:YggS family pyridoxal phosphate-dependent enzyme [Planctomycetia bacterium]
MILKSVIEKNLAEISRQITSAAEKVGRNAEEISLIAVTKYAPDEAVAALLELGVRDFGESRQQMLSRRAQKWPREIFPDLRWHFIGPLQKNKMRRVLQVAHLIHSGESLEMLTALNHVAQEEGLRAKVLLEVNLSGEKNKHGFSPETLTRELEQIFTLKNLEIHGLMGMTSLDATETDAHFQFALLRRLRDSLREQIHVFSPDLAAIFRLLSMGMSDDYPVAIMEGASVIRVGSAIFEGISPDI